MRAWFHMLLLCGLSVVFSGCAGVGIFATSDPATRLHDASDLFDRKDSPLIAEKFIREAVDSYRKNNDQPGLANAYLTYGFFFRSSAIEGRWSEYYRKNGFLDKSASFDGRYEKSIEYLEKARNIFTEYKRFDALINVNLNIGFTYEVMGYGEAACQAFDRSLENNRDNLHQVSSVTVALPKGFATYEEFLKPHMARAGCLEGHDHLFRKHAVRAA